MPHIHKLIDYTVEVFIVYKKTVLLRLHDKYGVWLGVGGHIELNENPNEAALREVLEEVGLRVVLYSGNKLYTGNTSSQTELIPPVFLNQHSINDSHQHIASVYFALSDTDQLTPDTEHEVSAGCKWFTFSELDDPRYEIADNIRFYAKEAFKRLAC